MAEALPLPMNINEEKNCVNCDIFGWKQPRDRSTLKRCSRCQLYWYCSQQYQKEHWLNSHKHHCKYFLSQKVPPNAKHNDATCLVCKEESKAGKENMTKPTNAVLPCYMSTAHKYLMGISQPIGPGLLPQYEGIPAKPLAEMTGVYHTKLDASFAIMMRILVKIKMTNNIIWMNRKSSVEDLYRFLGEFRLHEWFQQLVTKPGLDPKKKVNDCGGSIVDLIEAVNYIDSLISIVPETSPLKPWNTFKMLMTFCFDSKIMEGALIFDHLAVATDMSKEFENIRMKHATFQNLWDNVLNMLKEGLVPSTTLVEVLSEENPVRKCYECGALVTLQGVTMLLGKEVFYAAGHPGPWTVAGKWSFFCFVREV